MSAIIRGFAALGIGSSLVIPASAQTVSPASDPHADARAIIADVQKLVSPNHIDETEVVTLNGTRQVVNVRGTDRRNPILIYLHGGPGSVEMPMAWTFQRPWEDYFTVVQWDQRAAGRSWPLNDPAAIEPTLQLETYRNDGIALIEWLKARYGKQKVILLGHSFGSAVGLAIAEARPDLLHAYVGMGQLIDFRENERVGMRSALETAREHNDQDGIQTIEALAPYPDSGPFTIQQADAWRVVANKYGSLAGERSNADFYFNSTRLSPPLHPRRPPGLERGKRLHRHSPVAKASGCLIQPADPPRDPRRSPARPQGHHYAFRPRGRVAGRTSGSREGRCLV